MTADGLYILKGNIVVSTLENGYNGALIFAVIRTADLQFESVPSLGLPEKYKFFE